MFLTHQITGENSLLSQGERQNEQARISRQLGHLNPRPLQKEKTWILGVKKVRNFWMFGDYQTALVKTRGTEFFVTLRRTLS